VVTSANLSVDKSDKPDDGDGGRRHDAHLHDHGGQRRPSDAQAVSLKRHLAAGFTQGTITRAGPRIARASLASRGARHDYRARMRLVTVTLYRAAMSRRATGRTAPPRPPRLRIPIRANNTGSDTTSVVGGESSADVSINEDEVSVDSHRRDGVERTLHADGATTGGRLMPRACRRATPAGWLHAKPAVDHVVAGELHVRKRLQLHVARWERWRRAAATSRFTVKYTAAWRRGGGTQQHGDGSAARRRPAGENNTAIDTNTVLTAAAVESRRPTGLSTVTLVTASTPLRAAVHSGGPSDAQGA
jgi:hypothetical protein